MARFTTSDGLSLYYEDDGTGPPLLCLAGLTRNCRDFDFVARHLSNYRLIRMDYRGRGQSDREADFSNYNVLREGQDALELLDHLGVEKTCILGTSRGGFIAMVLAKNHPDRVTGVILNDAGPDIGRVGIMNIMAQAKSSPAWADFETRTAQSPIENSQMGETDYDIALQKALLEEALTRSYPDLWPYFDGMRHLPLGLIRGARSEILEPETVTRMQKSHPDMIVAEVPGRGHAPFLNEPDALRIIHEIAGKTS